MNSYQEDKKDYRTGALIFGVLVIGGLVLSLFEKSQTNISNSAECNKSPTYQPNQTRNNLYHATNISGLERVIRK